MRLTTVTIRDDVRIYVHNDLQSTSHFLKQKIDQQIQANDRAGLSLEIMACLIMIAFTFEAQINFIGHKRIKNWKERARIFTKYRKVGKKLGYVVDKTRRPHSTIWSLVEFRNLLAHGKPVERKSARQVDVNLEDLELPRILEAGWEKFATQDFLNMAYEDVEVIWKSLLQSAEIAVIDTVTSGGSTVEYAR